jgi:hypothetical protein
MPIHDWTRVTAGVFDDFHSAWIVAIRGNLNAGLLPDGYYAMAEQVAGNIIPDVLTLQDASDPDAQDDWKPAENEGGLAIAKSAPRTLIHDRLNETRALASRRRRIAIRHTTGDRVVALLEIVSPGNKGSSDAAEQFVDKAAAALHAGYHLMLLDLFPPGPFDPRGMHGKLWGSLGGEYVPPAGKPLTLAAYATGGGGPVDCYVEPTAVGTELLEMPLFLSTERYINVPLEETYRAAYVGVPKRWKQVIETPRPV